MILVKYSLKDDLFVCSLYFQDDSGSVPKKRKVISAHAKGVMLEYYDQISDAPDQAGLNVMSNVLNLDKKIIKRFFKNERSTRKPVLDKSNTCSKDWEDMEAR